VFHHGRCLLQCGPSIDYDTIDDTLIHTRYVQEFGTDLSGAQNYITNTYEISHSYDCYYDTTNLTTIRWSIAYNNEYIAISAVFGAAALIFLMAGVHLILTDKYGRDAEIVCLEFICWFTFIIPLIILTPIMLYAPVSRSDIYILTYFICQSVTLGIAPLCFFIHRVHGVSYILTIYLSIGVIIPSKPFISVSNSSEFYGLIISMSILAFGACVWVFNNHKPIFQLLEKTYKTAHKCITSINLPTEQSASQNPSAPPSENFVNAELAPPSYKSVVAREEVESANTHMDS